MAPGLSKKKRKVLVAIDPDPPYSTQQPAIQRMVLPSQLRSRYQQFFQSYDTVTAPPSSQSPPAHIPLAFLDLGPSEVTPSAPSLTDVAPPLSRYQQLLQSHGIVAPPPFSQLPSTHVPSVFLDPTPLEVAPPAPSSSSQSPRVHTSHTELEPIDHTHPTMDVTPDVSSIGRNHYKPIFT